MIPTTMLAVIAVWMVRPGIFDNNQMSNITAKTSTRNPRPKRTKSTRPDAYCNNHIITICWEPLRGQATGTLNLPYLQTSCARPPVAHSKFKKNPKLAEFLNFLNLLNI